jgi:hypothetical protein
MTALFDFMIRRAHALTIPSDGGTRALAHLLGKEHVGMDGRPEGRHL